MRGRLGALLRQTPRKYLLGCGALMSSYTLLLYLAVGFAADRQELVVVTVANYLWPGLTLAFSVPLLHHKASLGLLATGIAASTAGITMAVGGSGNALLDGITGPVIAALAAAVLWALYSNLSRRWAADATNSGMPLFLLVTGIWILLARLLVPERPSWTAVALLEVVYMTIFPTLLAYTFWDVAMRKGNVVLVAVSSYFTPLLSVWISDLYLGSSVRAIQWVACLVVILGGVCCKGSIRRDQPFDVFRRKGQPAKACRKDEVEEVQSAMREGG